jgi:hypothetical protein
MTEAERNADRREFLKTGAISLAAFFATGCSKSWFGATTISPLPNSFRSTLLATVEAPNIALDPDKGKVVLALPSIYSRVQSLPPNTALATLESQAGSALATNPWAPENLTGAMSFFEGSHEDAAENLGSAVRFAAGWGSVLFPPAAPVLRLAALMPWSLLGNPNFNPFAQDKSAGQEINQTILKRAAEYHDDPSGGNFKRVLDSPLLRQRSGVDFGASQDSLIPRLPPELQDVAAEAANNFAQNFNNNVQLQQQAFDRLFNKYSALHNAYEQSYRDFKALVERQHTLQEEQEARAALAQFQSRIQSGIVIFRSFIKHVFGDDRAADDAARILSGMATIGICYLSGNYLGAVAAAVSLFDGGGSNATVALLQDLGRRMERLRTEMHDRFDRLEEQQRLLLDGLAKIYRAVDEGFLVTQQRVEDLQAQFNRQVSLTEEDQRNAAAERIKEAASAIRSLRENRREGWLNQAVQHQPKFETFSRVESRQSYFRGPTTISAGELSAELDSKKDAERLIGLIPQICRNVQISGVPGNLANPFALAYGAEAYMQADLLLHELTNSQRPSVLLNMWHDALNVRSALNTVSAESTLTTCAEDLEKKAGLLPPGRRVFPRGQDYPRGRPRRPGYDEQQSYRTQDPPPGLIDRLKGSEERFTTEVLKPRYTLDPPVRWNGVGRPPFDFYATPVRNTLSQNIFKVNFSPFERALELGLIGLEEEGRETFPGVRPIEMFRHFIKINRGPRAGYLKEGNERLILVRMIFDGSPNGQKSFVKEPWITGQVTFVDFDWVLAYCEKLLGFHYGTETMLGFPSWLRRSSFDLGPYGDSAARLKLAATIARWRLTDGPEIQGLTDVRNVSILSTRDAVIGWLQEKIVARTDEILKNPSQEFDTADPRPLLLHEKLKERLTADIAEIRGMPHADPSKSVPIIDGLLKKLAFYMKSHNIDFPIPQI